MWLGFGAQLREFAPEVTRSARYLADSGALVGDAQAALAAAVTVVTGEGDLTLEKLAAGFEELGHFLQQVALQVQYMKIIVIEELVVLAAQIAYLIAMMPWTFGASAAGIAALQVFGRQFAMALLRQLAVAIAVGQVLQVGLDAIAQFAQIMEGVAGRSLRREGWDQELTRSAVITGVVGGVLGPLLEGLGHAQARLLGKALGGMIGRNAGHEAGDWAVGVLKGGLHEWVTDGGSGLLQGQGWRPNTFSLTAGAADEGVTGAAQLGGRKGGHRFYLHGPGPGPVIAPPKIQLPGPLDLDRQDLPVLPARTPTTGPAVGSTTGPTTGSTTGPTVGELLDLGRARLDRKERLEDTISREQDRPRLLLLTEGLAAALDQVARSFGVHEPTAAVGTVAASSAGDLRALTDPLRHVARHAAVEIVNGLAPGVAQNARLRSLIEAAHGPFGESTWHRLVTTISDLPHHHPAARDAALAAINDDFAALTLSSPGFGGGRVIPRVRGRGG